MSNATELSHVTVYALGAVIERRGTITSDALTLRFGGLPLSLNPGSLRARLEGAPATVAIIGVHAELEGHLTQPPDLGADEAALAKAEAEKVRLEAALHRVKRDLQDLAGLAPAKADRVKGAAPAPAPVAAWLELAKFVDEGLVERTPRFRALEQQLHDATNEVALLRARVAEHGRHRAASTKVLRTAVVQLSAPANGATVVLEYQVPGARWAPAYALKLAADLTSGELSLRAHVAQDTGEDWSPAKISLSTASLERRSDVPELRALRIGRDQPPPPPSGWREPPPGLEALFGSYDDALNTRPVTFGSAPKGGAPAPMQVAAAVAAAPPPPPKPPARPAPAPKLSKAGSRGGAPPAPGAPPPMSAMAAPMAPPMMERAKRRSVEAEESVAESYAMDRDEGAVGGADMASFDEAPEPEASFLPATDALDYGALEMAPPRSPSARGTLSKRTERAVLVLEQHVQIEVHSVVSLAVERAKVVADLDLPNDAVSVRDAADAYDYRYDTATPVDVPSTGRWVVVPVASAQVAIAPGYASVPSVDPKVYRLLEVANRSVHALLEGPVDVSQGDTFLLTTTLPFLPPQSGTARLGLGVEESIKIARRTSSRETSGGLLGGSTVLPHEIEIDVENRLPHPVKLEVRERVPVTTDAEVKIEESQVKPPWQKDEKLRDGVQVDGARRWELTVAAKSKTQLSAQFTIRIPSGRMLEGGNRRA